mmetsp:Transcript_1630/g.4467  ORF Transcript_1630/g.4467 Transcript_1630/m.4467 type:complete len:304 (-) Transcript_1630:118-1029(-)
MISREPWDTLAGIAIYEEQSALRALDLGCRHLLAAHQWTDWHLDTEDGTAGDDGVGDAGKDGGDNRCHPVDEVMLMIARHFVLVADAEGIPCSGEHGVHGWSGGWVHLDQHADGDGRQELLDEVMVLSEVHSPVENVNGPQKDVGGEEFRKRGLNGFIARAAEFGSAKRRHLERLGDGLEQWEGHESTTHLSSDAHECLGVAAFAQRPHGCRDGRVDLLPTSEVVGGDDTDGMESPGHVHVILADPFAGRECEGDHEDGSHELIEVHLDVLAFTDEGGGDAQHDAGREVLQRMREDVVQVNDK